MLDLDSLIQPVDDGSNYEDVEPGVVDALTEDNRRIVRESCEAFVNEWVQMDEVDDPTPHPFHLWPAQETVLDAFTEGGKHIVLKARQLGLTWLALAYALWRMLTRPGYRVVALSRSEDEAKELVRRVAFILTYLPWWLVQPGRPSGPVIGWQSSSMTVTITHPSGRVSSFIAFPASPNAGRSFTASLVLIDEWAFQQYAEEIWSAAFPTINRPNSGEVIGLSTGARGVLFERMWRDARAGRNFFKPIFLPWWSHPERTQQWYNETKANLPNSYRREYPANEEDAFSAGAGAFFPEWSDPVHVAFADDWYPQGDSWRIVIAYDPGFSTRASCHWYAIHPDGWSVGYREYYPQRVTDADQAAEIRRLSATPKGEREQIFAFLIPTDARLKSSETGNCTWDTFEANGWRLTAANNNRINGWRVLHECLKPFEGQDGKQTALLRFTRACPESIRHFPAGTQDKNNPEELNYSEDHVIDDARYFVMAGIAPKPPETRVINRKQPPAPRSKITGY